MCVECALMEFSNDVDGTSTSSKLNINIIYIVIQIFIFMSNNLLSYKVNLFDFLKQFLYNKKNQYK